MWVRLPSWMIHDEDPPLPTAGAVLAGVGIRVEGKLSQSPPGEPEGVVELSRGTPAHVAYRVTGRGGPAKDVFVGGVGGHPEHAGGEFVLSLGAERVQACFEGRAQEVASEDHVSMTGSLWIVGSYEWDAFDLVDTRTVWFVRAVVQVEAGAVMGDAMLDLVKPDARHTP